MDDFSNLSGLTQSSSEEDDNIPESWKALGNASTQTRKSEIDGKIRVHMFYTDHSSNLETGKGRDDLTSMVYSELSEKYDADDLVDLQIFLLDELDNKGELRGKELHKYMEEFTEEDGDPDYLSETSYQL